RRSSVSRERVNGLPGAALEVAGDAADPPVLDLVVSPGERWLLGGGHRSVRRRDPELKPDRVVLTGLEAVERRPAVGQRAVRVVDEALRRDGERARIVDAVDGLLDDDRIA